MIVEKESNVKLKLKEIFGYNNFRGNQEAIINNILSGRNTFVIMPTGAGKSLCYQLPAVIKEGTAIVISPLIALMKNQVDQMNAVGIKAYFLNSTLNKSEIARVKSETLSGEAKLLYVAPESLTKEENMTFLRQAKLSFVAIDEAHCISEWGHDFRPEYRKIKSIIKEIGDMPIIALTATATPKVQLDIQRNLHMEDADVFKSSFNRDNLYYEIRPKVQAKKQLVRYIKERKGKSGIIYCLSRKSTERLAEKLNNQGYTAAAYHAAPLELLELPLGLQALRRPRRASPRVSSCSERALTTSRVPASLRRARTKASSRAVSSTVRQRLPFSSGRRTATRTACSTGAGESPAVSLTMRAAMGVPRLMSKGVPSSQPAESNARRTREAARMRFMMCSNRMLSARP